MAIHCGMLALSGEQAKCRAHALKEIKKGVYEVLSPVEFKQGEVFGHDGDLPKVLANLVESTKKGPSSRKRKRKPEAKADADAEAKADAFADAVSKLETGNTGHWTEDAKPECKALEALGVKVSAKERDALWSSHQADNA